MTLPRCCSLSLLFLLAACAGDEDGSTATAGTAAEDTTAGDGADDEPADDGADDDTDSADGVDDGADDGDTSNDDNDDDADDADPTAADTTGVDTGDDADTDATTTGTPEEPPPTNGAELLPWLQAGTYEGWTAESAPHTSTGPHFGTVRTFVNDALFDSLSGGSDPHPMGSATVKELYGSGASVLGWSVLVKVADGSGGDTWYFYEYYDGTTYGDAVGDGSCTGCHGAGAVDYFKSPFPLQ